MKNRFTRFLVLAALASFASFSSFAADLIVNISGVHTAQGKVFIALYASEAQMKNRQPLQAQIIEAAKRTVGGKVNVTFTDLAPGSYAVGVFHDSDDNGKLSGNLSGMPTEPYGFSNNAEGLFGPPSFEEAALTIGSDNVRIAIHLK